MDMPYLPAYLCQGAYKCPRLQTVFEQLCEAAIPEIAPLDFFIDGVSAEMSSELLCVSHGVCVQSMLSNSASRAPPGRPASWPIRPQQSPSAQRGSTSSQRPSVWARQVASLTKRPACFTRSFADVHAVRMEMQIWMTPGFCCAAGVNVSPQVSRLSLLPCSPISTCLADCEMTLLGSAGRQHQPSPHRDWWVHSGQICQAHMFPVGPDMSMHDLTCTCMI